MIRTTPKEPSKGLKRTPLKRKPFKRKPPKSRIKSPQKIGSIPLRKIKRTVAKNPPKVRTAKPKILKQWNKDLLQKYNTEIKKRKGLRIRIDPLDSLVSEYVRKRAVKQVGGCEKCLKPYRWQDLQCSHFFGRKDKATRYDLDNLAGICFYCHNCFHAFPLEHVQWFEQHLGKERFELLQGRNRILEKPDKKILTIYFQQQIKILDNAIQPL